MIGRKSVCAHVLVKNESRFVWYAVMSVLRHVDEIKIWDTGSTDNTQDIIQKILDLPEAKGKVFYKTKPTDNFDEAYERQGMLKETNTNWFIVVDADEIWFEDSIKKVIETINKAGNSIESVIVPTINLVGDIFHYQEKSAGRYKFGDRVGHYNLRAVRRNIQGLCSKGEHGVWGWADGDGKMIQDRNTYKFIEAPYLHATNLRRSPLDKKVIKRKKKYRFELGETFPKDFYYPEVFFKDRPAIIPSPWEAMSKSFKFRAFFETPLRRLKRKIWQGSPGY